MISGLCNILWDFWFLCWEIPIYVLLTFTVFLTLQALAIITPALFGFAFYLFYATTIDTSNSSTKNILYLAGIIGSVITGLKAVTALETGFTDYKAGITATDPRILSLVNSVADKVGIERFREVRLTLSPDISTAYIGTGRYLLISAFALRYLTYNELEAIVAHECAHHHDSAMLPNRIHYRTTILFIGFRNALSNVWSAFSRIRQKGGSNSFFGSGFIITGTMMEWSAMFQMPYIYIFGLYLNAMAHLIRDPEYEYYCDSVAIDLMGGGIFESALRKVLDIHIIYRSHLINGRAKLKLWHDEKN